MLRDLTFEVPAGRTLLIVGRNGAGKSTLLRLILGLDTPDAGSVRVLGSDPRSARHLRPRIGALLHEDALYPQLTVGETLDLWIGVSRSRRSVADLLQEVGLEAAADRRAGVLSAGMRKRLALARTLLNPVSLMLWDEPLAALDADGRQRVLDCARSLRRTGVTLLATSHETAAFESIADSILDLGSAPGSERQRGEVAE